jgi:hypothetical protein
MCKTRNVYGTLHGTNYQETHKWMYGLCFCEFVRVTYTVYVRAWLCNYTNSYVCVCVGGVAQSV